MLERDLIFTTVKLEVQDSDRVHGFQFVVPRSPSSLFSNRECCIIQAPVFEERLFALLHLHKELFPMLPLAVNVKHGLSVQFATAEVLCVQVCDVADNLLSAEKQRIEETDEQFLVHRSPKQLFETKVGVWVYVPVTNKTVLHHLPSPFFHKVTNFLPIFLTNNITIPHHRMESDVGL